MARPRILLVPTLTELEWAIAPALREWADVATYDAPGVGDEPLAGGPPSRMQIVERGLAEMDERGWDSCAVVGDEYGGWGAVHIAAARPERVAGLALGHACLDFRLEGERAPVNGDVMGAFMHLASTDYRTYARHLTQLTQDAYDDELADAYRERVPQEVTLAFDTFTGAFAEEPLEPLIRQVDAPLLLAKHDGCLAWTDEGYEDAAAAFPDARTFSTKRKPSVCEDFAAELRAFCEELEFESAGDAPQVRS